MVEAMRQQPVTSVENKDLADRDVSSLTQHPPFSVPVSCRGCGRVGLTVVLSLGRTPLANALLTESQLGEPEETYPLDLAFCSNCSLVQITETVPPEALFREYFYLSSFSETM